MSVTTRAGAGAPGEQRDGSLPQTFGFARPVSRRVLLACLLGAGAVGAGIGLLATSAWLVSRASQHPEESALALGIVAVQLFGLSRGLLRYGQRLTSHDAAFRALAGLRVRVYEHLERLLPTGLPSFHSGDLLARFVDDVESLQDLVVRVICPLAIAILVGLATVAFVWSILPVAGVILLVTLLLAGTALPWLSGRLARRGEARQAAARGELTTAVVDLVRGAPELAAYGAAEARLEQASAIDARLARIAGQTARTAGVGQGLASLLPGLAMFMSLVAGLLAVQDGHLPVVLLAVVTVVPLAAFELTTGLPAAAQSLARVRASLGRVSRVLDAPPRVIDPTDPTPLPAGALSLRVRDLRCRYEEDGRWALDGLSLDLAPGRRVAIVGRSGAGKSTLANVLLRFLAYQRGSVTLGGVELSDLRGDDCRRAVGLVAQDAHIFDSTLEANLRLARPDATADQLRDALARARLLDWVQELPAGLQTEVGEHGGRISGGQRQRLAAARALLADFPLLLLDEPGEHLDTATADAIVADLLDAAGDRSVLLITHRLAGLEAVDEVIVLDAGRALERGTHAELLARGGAYLEMWRREGAERFRRDSSEPGDDRARDRP
ncbi:MAG TPA: thiol reductant ABC exporter subunit CydC [Solirubrobacteraceae bacterium]